MTNRALSNYAVAYSASKLYIYIYIYISPDFLYTCMYIYMVGGESHFDLLPGA